MRMDTIPRRFFGLAAMVMRIRSGVGWGGMLRGMANGPGIDVESSMRGITRR